MKFDVCVDDNEVDDYHEYVNDRLNSESLSCERIVDRGCKRKLFRIVKINSFFNRKNRYRKEKSVEKVELGTSYNNGYYKTAYR